MINIRGIFSDESSDFLVPNEVRVGEKVTIYIRALRDDVHRVDCVLNGIEKNMTKAYSKGRFDYFSLEITCPNEEVNYYFVLYDQDDMQCYNKYGASDTPLREYNFRFIPNFKVAEWAKGVVSYQIFVERFCNGDQSNDVLDNEYYYIDSHTHRVTNWNEKPKKRDLSYFYGGDLQGVRSKLNYLKDLGIEAVLFNPIFLSPSNHKYDTQDYDYIDPHFAIIEEDELSPMLYWEKHNGYARQYIKRVTSKVNLEKSNEYFASLVSEMHDMGLKVILDGVFNHCGSYNKWMDREGIYLYKQGYEYGAYQSESSPYRSYFTFDKPVAYSTYKGWWNHNTLPKLNYDSKLLTNHIQDIGAKWVSSPYNVDGWRLDVGADLGETKEINHAFWQGFREKVINANPNAFIFAEHYGNPSEWLNGKEWDSVMNYDAFMEPVTWFLTGMEKHSDYSRHNRKGDGVWFFQNIGKYMNNLPRPSLESALNQLSNHDHSRFLTRTNGVAGRLNTHTSEDAERGIDKSLFAVGVCMQMTWLGSPGIYYGDEAGVCGWTDPDNRRTYPWGNEDKELIDLHKRLITFRKSVHCLKKGSIKKMEAGNGYIAYARFDSVDAVVVLVNINESESILTLPVWEIGVEDNAILPMAVSTIKDDVGSSIAMFGRISVVMPPKSARVYTYKYKD